LRYLILGKSLSEIARYRNRSLKTISCQKSKLYNKLGIESDLTLWRDLYFKRYICIT
ncbi:TPA: transcriptional regulator, partial [Escherichia coli]|nr:transcriptional regulator [Escherichia coli]EIY9833076.1 transcriptional regulator [Escherichia coli]HDV2332452.1 transcriptional regulator [Escherichia coli]HDV3775783.1 transcriptional regulator [Escherichia coli]